MRKKYLIKNKTEGSNMTAESLVQAVRDSKAVTISGVWRHLGHKSAISGSQSKKIRALVPDIDAMLQANKNGAPVEVVPAVKEPTKNVTKGVKVFGYRAGSAYAAIVAEGNKGFKDVEAFLTRLAKSIPKYKDLYAKDPADALKRVEFSYRVVAPHKDGAKSPSNRGTKLVTEADGTLRIVEVPKVEAPKEQVNA